MFFRAITLFGLLAIIANVLLSVSATPIPAESMDKRICLRSCKIASIDGNAISAPIVPTSSESQVILKSSTEVVVEAETLIAATSTEELASTEVPEADVETVVPTASPASSAFPSFVTKAAVWPVAANVKTNGASSQGPTAAAVAIVAAVTTLIFSL